MDINGRAADCFWGFEKKKCFNFLAALAIHFVLQQNFYSFAVIKYYQYNMLFLRQYCEDLLKTCTIKSSSLFSVSVFVLLIHQAAWPILFRL